MQGDLPPVYVPEAMLTPKAVNKLGYSKLIILCRYTSSFGIVLLSTSSSFAGICLGRSLNEGATSIFNIMTRTIRQKMIPKEYLGRVSGIYRMVALMSYPLGGFIGGALAEFYSLALIFKWCSIILIFISTIYLFTDIRKIDEKMCEFEYNLNNS